MKNIEKSVLPSVASPLGNYLSWVKSGNLIFVSGQGPKINGSYVNCGKVGLNCSKEEAIEAARLTGLNLLACLEEAANGLENVARIVSLRGYVNSTDDFTEQPAVIDGISGILTEVLGEERGRSSRCAISVNALPLGMAVEAELVAELVVSNVYENPEP